MATTWNSADKVTVTLSNGDLTGNCTATNNSIVRATTAIASGKAYFEVAWSGAFRGNSTMVGIALLSSSLANISSASTGAVSYGCSGLIFNNSGTFIATGHPVWNNATPVTICVAVDLNNDRIWFRLDNGVWNNNGSADPATNVGGLDVSNLFASAGAAPIALFQGNTGIIATANFGATTFAQAVPSGFVSGWLEAAPVVLASGDYTGGASRGRMTRSHSSNRQRRKRDEDEPRTDIGRQTYEGK